MEIYITVVTFMMPLLMKKFTNVVIPTYFIHFWYILHPNICVMNIVMNDWNLVENSLNKW